MDIVQYVLNFFFPGDSCWWGWNYLTLILIVAVARASNKYIESE